MNIQTVGSSYIIQSPKGSYFQNFYKRVCALEGALKSGNQDRVTLSENPLAKTMTHIETNLAAITPDSPFYSGPTPIGDQDGPFSSEPTPIVDNESPFYSGPTPIGENESPFSSQPTPVAGYGRSVQSQATSSVMVLNITT